MAGRNPQTRWQGRVNLWELGENVAILKIWDDFITFANALLLVFMVLAGSAALVKLVLVLVAVACQHEICQDLARPVF